MYLAENFPVQSGYQKLAIRVYITVVIDTVNLTPHLRYPDFVEATQRPADDFMIWPNSKEPFLILYGSKQSHLVPHFVQTGIIIGAQNDLLA